MPCKVDQAQHPQQDQKFFIFIIGFPLYEFCVIEPLDQFLKKREIDAVDDILAAAFIADEARPFQYVQCG